MTERRLNPRTGVVSETAASVRGRVAHWLRTTCAVLQATVSPIMLVMRLCNRACARYLHWFSSQCGPAAAVAEVAAWSEQGWSEFIADEAAYNRACLAASGWSFAVVDEAMAPHRLLSAEIRYYVVKPGDQAKIVLQRAGFRDEELWGWVLAIGRGDEPRIVITLSCPPASPHMLALCAGDSLLVKPRELAAAAVWDEDDTHQGALIYNA